MAGTSNTLQQGESSTTDSTLTMGEFEKSPELRGFFKRFKAGSFPTDRWVSSVSETIDEKKAFEFIYGMEPHPNRNWFIFWRQREEGRGKIRTYHSCAYSNDQCSCINLQRARNLGLIRGPEKRAVYIGDLDERWCIDWCKHNFSGRRKIIYAKIGETSEDLKPSGALDMWKLANFRCKQALGLGPAKEESEILLAKLQKALVKEGRISWELRVLSFVIR